MYSPADAGKMSPMSKPQQFKVAGAETGTPLITLLARRLSVSRNEAKRLIDSRSVFVNNQRVWMAKHQLAGGDRIEVHGLRPEAGTKPCSILWQDDRFLIIDKPAGWLSNGPGSIEERLREENDRPVYAVHRLDRDTSGCMLLAWRRADVDRMIPVFQRREVLKVYEGLVIGKIPPGLSLITRSVEGEDAETRLRVVKKHGASARVEFTLVTGRTHQIRRHLTSFGLHLAGEKSYGATVLERPELRTIPRHMLHARMLGFPHPYTEKFIQVRAAFPSDYRAAARLLGV